MERCNGWVSGNSLRTMDSRAYNNKNIQILEMKLKPLSFIQKENLFSDYKSNSIFKSHN